MKLRQFFLLVALAAASAGIQTTAQTVPDRRFPLGDTPERVTRFAYTIYPSTAHNVYNIRGNMLSRVGDRITDVAVNPIGTTYTIVTRDKKGRGNARVYRTDRQGIVNHKFKAKKFGNISAVTYTPDALNILLAADSTLHVVDSRKYGEKSTMALAHPVTKMALSNNAYHLATTDGAKVTVYNYEDKSIRHQWDFGSGVNDILFSDDDTEFAVLTDDGSVSIYDTRTYIIKHTIENVGDALAASYHFDGKYIAVAQSPSSIVIVNILEPETDRHTINPAGEAVSDVVFVPDTKRNTFLAHTAPKALEIHRIADLQPFYSRLVNDEVDRRMNEWLKRMPDESLEDYRLRVNDETRARQRRLFEDEVATKMAPDMLTMAEVSLGAYDKKHELLEVNFSNMPSIYLPVTNEDINAFNSAGDLSFTNARYTVHSNDRFEMIYAEVVNSADGKTYIYDNIERTPMNFMEDDEEDVSLALIEQQQMEEIKLRELQERIVEEAKSRNIISDHTNIAVSTEVIPDYDANGNKILNYKVNYTYEVDPGFTAQEDFGPGKYHIDQSGAAKSMLEIVQKSLAGDLARYVKEGKKANIRISGTADSSPIVGRIIYDGIYGEFDEEPVYNNGEISAISVTPKGRITANEQLAFLRAQGVKSFLEENVKELSQMKTNYRIDINVAEGKGSQFRRITTEIVFVDAL